MPQHDLPIMARGNSKMTKAELTEETISPCHITRSTCPERIMLALELEVIVDLDTSRKIEANQDVVQVW